MSVIRVGGQKNDCAQTRQRLKTVLCTVIVTSRCFADGYYFELILLVEGIDSYDSLLPLGI